MWFLVFNYVFRFFFYLVKIDKLVFFNIFLILPFAMYAFFVSYVMTGTKIGSVFYDKY